MTLKSLLQQSLCFVLLLASINVFSQTTVRGTIIDKSTGEGLISATVILQEDPSVGVITDFDGNFEIEVPSIPIMLVISYTGYAEQAVEVTDASENIRVELSDDAIMMDVIEVKGQRISDKQKETPLTVESMDILAIKETPAENFYDGLGAMKGVDLTAASLGFKVINTRGFNSTSPVRSLQIIDGVDNQAPGLNFSLGNFLGASELDVLKVDLVVGASSAFYGPNAFNGVISMTTKNPFFQKGLSAFAKVGERNLGVGAFRWADAVQNKFGEDVFAYKFNFFYLRADDWVADNNQPVDGTDTGVNNPGGYDAVNIYGDEYYSGNDYSTATPWTYPGMTIVHRRGYREEDLVDYDTRNIKANAAFHFRLDPSKAEESPEFIISSNFGTGTTVYQGDNRFSLKNILFFQNRLELRKGNDWFIRTYATHENAGDSYDPYFTALKLQEAAKTDFNWSQDYSSYWVGRIKPKAIRLGFPESKVIGFDPETGQVITEFDQEVADNWVIEYQDSLFAWHNLAQNFANQANPITGSQAFFEPGTDRFNEEFNRIISTSRNEGGTLFTDRSALYHLHGEYKFQSNFFDEITVGGNSRLYRPVSEGTLFNDGEESISNFEFGVYGGVNKDFFDDKLKAQVTLRVDKNENFKTLLSPAASLVYKPTNNNFLRLSFSSAIRNPTLTDQYLSLNVGRAILAGNINGVQGLATIESLGNFLDDLDPTGLEYFDIDPIQPEEVKSFELGYRTTLFNSTYLDASYYFSIYDNFIGYNIGADIDLDPATNFPTNIQIYRYSANSINTVTTQGFSIGINHYFARYFMFGGNYSWNKLNTDIDDPIIPAFNTPEHKFNINLSGRNIQTRIGNLNLKNFGFNINYKWIEGFIFEGSPQFTGIIPSYDLLDAQVNYKVEKWNTTFKLGASNLLDNKQFQTYGGPRIGRLGYFSILYEFVKK